MSENNLHDHIQNLAEQVASSTDEDVLDSGEIIGKLYQRERIYAQGMAMVDSMMQDGPDIPEDHPRLVAARERLRERLRALLTWARETGRM